IKRLMLSAAGVCSRTSRSAEASMTISGCLSQPVLPPQVRDAVQLVVGWKAFSAFLQGWAVRPHFATREASIRKATCLQGRHAPLARDAPHREHCGSESLWTCYKHTCMRTTCQIYNTAADYENTARRIPRK